MSDSKRVKVSGEKSLLINEGVTISTRMKDDKKRLEEIKTELGYKDAGIYVTAKGCVLDITEKKLPVTIPPEDVFEELKKLRLGKRFGECVGVVIKKLENVIGKDLTDKIKNKYKAETTKSWSFK